MYPVVDITKFDAYDSYTINTKMKKKRIKYTLALSTNILV